MNGVSFSGQKVDQNVQIEIEVKMKSKLQTVIFNPVRRTRSNYPLKSLRLEIFDLNLMC